MSCAITRQRGDSKRRARLIGCPSEVRRQIDAVVLHHVRRRLETVDGREHLAEVDRRVERLTEQLPRPPDRLAPYLRARRPDVELDARAGGELRLVAAIVVGDQPAGKLLGEIAVMIALRAQQPLEGEVGELRAQATPRRIERQRTLEVSRRRTKLAGLAGRERLDLGPQILAFGPAVCVEQLERAARMITDAMFRPTGMSSQPAGSDEETTPVTETL